LLVVKGICVISPPQNPDQHLDSSQPASSISRCDGSAKYNSILWHRSAGKQPKSYPPPQPLKEVNYAQNRHTLPEAICSKPTNKIPHRLFRCRIWGYYIPFSSVCSMDLFSS